VKLGNLGTSRGKEIGWIVLFVGPGLLLALGIKFYPLFRGLYDSLFFFEGGWKPVYVGLDNFHRMFLDKTVQQTFFNALKVMLTIPVWVLFPLVLAFLIFQETAGWRVFRAVFFLPYVIAPIIVGQIFREILGLQGPLNAFLGLVGLKLMTTAWLANTFTAIWAMVAVVLWSFSGLGIITYLAGFATISDDIFDAAAIDGAGFLTKIFRIILPMTVPVIGYWTVLCTGGMLLWMFPFIHALTEGGPGHATMLPEYLVYITSFRFFERGYGTTIGVALFFVVLTFTFFQVRFMYEAGAPRQKQKGGAA
jgi:multiple sugar transport system permease protein/raffinose/stachyose/melibiose transport system permease protein